MVATVVLGWREWLALPGLGLPRVRAKVDTGARSSALHVDAQWRFVDGGAPWVGFRVSPGGVAGAVVECRAPLVDEREVTDSGGHVTRRAFVRTTLRLAGTEHEIDLNLVDRHRMRFPILLVRTAIAGVFRVDPARSWLHGRPAAAAALRARAAPADGPVPSSIAQPRTGP